MNQIQLTNIQNFRLLFVLRNFAILFGLFIVGTTQLFSNFDLAVNFHLALFIILIIANLFAYNLLRTNKTITNWHFFCLLLIDILTFAGHIYFSGGIYNPFIGFFILPIILAVLTLPNILGLSLISVSIISYSLLYFRYVPFNFKTSSPPDIFFRLHVLGMLVSFIIVAISSALFVYLLVKNLRKKEQMIAQDTHLKSLGIFTANAAHQLGTPLNSIQLISEEIADGVDIKTNSTLLSEQIERAKGIIQNILEKSGKDRQLSLSKVPLKEYFANICKDWQQYFLDCKLDLTNTMIDAPIIPNKDLTLALYNVFDNALNAEATEIKIHISAQGDSTQIIISDNGKGFKNKEAQGYGLYLTNLTIENLQGKINIATAKPTTISILIPTKRLLHE